MMASTFQEQNDDPFVYTYLGDVLDPNGDTPLIESDGGSGTAGGNWDEETYDTELMTGYIDTSNYIADMTYNTLEDLGYVLDIDYAYLLEQPLDWLEREALNAQSASTSNAQTTCNPFTNSF